MLQQTCDSEWFDCKILKPITHAIYISNSIGPIPLVQFNWYCKRGGDDDEALIYMGEGLNKPLFFQRCLQMFFIFLSRDLANVLEKNKKKNKTTSA